jgi:site-specific recombinase XerD
LKTWRILNLSAASCMIAAYVFEMRAQFFGTSHQESHLLLVNIVWVAVISSNLLWRVVKGRREKALSETEVESHGR